MESKAPLLHYVALSLGANIGNRRETLRRAVQAIAKSGNLVELALSPLYSTEPLGIREQPEFYNLALGGRTAVPLVELFAFLKELEKTLGRKERPRWHEREIDIDIILYGEAEYRDDNLTVPHPRAYQRLFVLRPLADIAAEDITFAGYQRTLSEMLRSCSDTSHIEQIRPLLTEEECQELGINSAKVDKIS